MIDIICDIKFVCSQLFYCVLRLYATVDDVNKYL